jgi:CHASE2 domain-containing sensor protein
MVYVILHYGMALFSFIALADGLIHLCRNRRVLFMPQEKAFDGTIALFFVLLFVLFFIASYSFFLCSGRYAMPLAPLFLALIAAFLSRISVKQQPKM